MFFGKFFVWFRRPYLLIGSISSVSYLYKYMFKGPDRTLFTVSTAAVDEMADYVQGRYLSASEAAWRILQFDITTKEPAVIALHVHLPGTNFSQMPRSTGITSKGTDLLRYFHRPAGNRFDAATFEGFFKYYRHEKFTPHVPLTQEEFLEQPSTSFPRLRVVTRSHLHNLPVCRIAMVPIRSGELYYCRALLKERPARSYEDLRTINDVVYGTFQEAAYELGLFETDSEAQQTMLEAVTHHSSPRQLRFLFCQIITNISCPVLEIFQQFQEQLTADYLDDTQCPTSSFNMLLLDLSRHIRAQGGTLTSFGLPEPLQRGDEVRQELDYFEGRRNELAAESQVLLATLNGEQKSACDEIEQEVVAHQSNGTRNPFADQPIWFLDGKAGRGKSYVVKALIAKLRSQGLIVLICGSTALSVTQYECGRTAHSLFGIPIEEVQKPELFYRSLRQ